MLKQLATTSFLNKAKPTISSLSANLDAVANSTELLNNAVSSNAEIKRLLL